MCFGRVVPDLDFQVGLEFGHRVVAGLISLLFLGLGALLVADRGLRPLMGWWLAAAAVLVVQVVLGGLTVLELLAEWTVTSHLLAGNTFCLLLLVIARLVSPGPAGRTTWVERSFASILLAVVLGQLALGGLVASSHAGLACGDSWPQCAGEAWFPTFSGAVGLQVVHRIGAYTVAAAAIALVVATRAVGPVGKASLVVLALVVVQIALGIVNVWFRMPIPVTMGHSAVAALLVLSSTWAVISAARARVAVSEPAVSLAPKVSS
jgi:cytochrome c oxidase assembly protein subunit 15